MKVRKEKVIAFLRSKHGPFKERCEKVKALTEVGTEILPFFSQLYEQELEWPTTPEYRFVLEQALFKLGGAEYLDGYRRHQFPGNFISYTLTLSG